MACGAAKRYWHNLAERAFLVLACALFNVFCTWTAVGQSCSGFIDNWQFISPRNYDEFASPFAYGAGRYVGFSVTRDVLTSQDGINWAEFGPRIPFEVQRIIYANGIFVADGDGGVITSSDGLTWTQTATASLRSVTWGNGSFVAVGGSGVFSSSDGTNWTQRLPDASFWGVAFGAGSFVAVGLVEGVGPIMARSADGLNWSYVNSGLPRALYSIAYGNGLFVAGGRWYFAYSSDGVTWTPVDPGPPGSSRDFRDITFGNGIFLSYDGTFVERSTDGINWAQAPGFTSISFANGQFFAKDVYGTLVPGQFAGNTLRSRDGLNWVGTPSLPALALTQVAYGQNQFIAVGAGGLIRRSLDGSTWSTVDSGVTNDLRAVAFGNGNFVAVGAYNLVLRSADGLAWTASSTGTGPDCAALSFGDGQFLALNGSLLTSTDGAVWTPTLLPPGPWTAAARANGTYVVVGDAGLLQVSTDGINWIDVGSSLDLFQCSCGVSADLYAVAYVNGQFVAAGQAGVMASSPDGLSWTALGEFIFNGPDISVLTFADGYYFAGAIGGIYRSTDLVNWTASSAYTINAFAANASTLVAVVGPVVLQTTPCRPFLALLAPDSAVAGGQDVTLSIHGANFQSGAVALWNGAPLASTVVSDSLLVATVPAANLAAANGNIATVDLTVTNPTGNVSSSLPFTIVNLNVGVLESQVASPGQVATADALPQAQDQAGVSATLDNSSGTQSVTVSASAYTSNPGSGTTFSLGSTYVDLKVSGADPSQSMISYFYYPYTVAGSAEQALSLLYYNGTGWVPVLSSGGTAPVKDTTDNLDTTVSGGRFTVTFDSTSTPQITQLTGTPFALAVDTTPPSLACPANLVVSTEPGQCSAHVAFSVNASDNSGSAKVDCSPPSGSAFPKGVTTVNCTATDPSGNSSHCSFTVTVNDTEPPLIQCPPPITVNSLADVPSPAPASVTASDNCPGVSVAWVGDTVPGGGACGGTILRAYQATDSSGNRSTCTQIITVLPQLVLSDEHAAIHYHGSGSAGVPTYSKAELHGVIQFCDPALVSDEVLSSLSESQVGAHVRAILGGVVIADNAVSLSISRQRQVWEATPGNGPVAAFKIQWQAAPRFNDLQSNPQSPAISSQFIGLTETSLRFDARPGTYTATLPNGVSVVVNNGLITAVNGLSTLGYEIRNNQTRVDLQLPYELVPDMVIQVSGSINDTITVTPNVNYFAEQGRFELRLNANGLAQAPLLNSSPDSLQYEITLGTGPGEHPAFGRSLIGAAAKPWAQEQSNHKLLNDDSTE